MPFLPEQTREHSGCEKRGLLYSRLIEPQPICILPSANSQLRAGKTGDRTLSRDDGSLLQVNAFANRAAHRRELRRSGREQYNDVASARLQDL